MQTPTEYAAYLDATGDLATILDSALYPLCVGLGCPLAAVIRWVLKPLTPGEKRGKIEPTRTSTTARRNKSAMNRNANRGA